MQQATDWYGLRADLRRSYVLHVYSPAFGVTEQTAQTSCGECKTLETCVCKTQNRRSACIDDRHWPIVQARLPSERRPWFRCARQRASNVSLNSRETIRCIQ